jgi:hypothetical protein
MCLHNHMMCQQHGLFRWCRCSCAHIQQHALLVLQGKLRDCVTHLWQGVALPQALQVATLSALDNRDDAACTR